MGTYTTVNKLFTDISVAQNKVLAIRSSLAQVKQSNGMRVSVTCSPGVPCHMRALDNRHG